MKTINELLSEIDKLKPIAGMAFSDINRVKFISFIKDMTGTEAKILHPNKSSLDSSKVDIDYTNIDNIRNTWDFILSAPTDTILDNYAIRDIHKNLCKNTENTEGGIYRTNNSYALRRQSPSFPKMLYKIEDAEYKMSANYAANTHTVIRAIETHSDLIEAQAFRDFNKRTARLIMNWFLIKNGYTPIIFDAPTDKAEYMESIRANLDGDTEKYTKYMLESMLRTQRDIITVIRNNTKPFTK